MMKRLKLIGFLAAYVVAVLIFPFPGAIPQDLAFDYTRRTPLPSVPDDPRPVVNPVQRLRTPQLPQVPDEQLQRGQFLFDGAWLPDEDPAKIGAKNYVTLQNLRYTDTSLEGILGYSKINTQAYYIGGDDGDANTQVILHGEAADDDPIIDSSPQALGTMVEVGTVAVSTTNRKYGSASIFGDGDGDYAYYISPTPDLGSMNFGAGNFTIDFWVYFVDPTQQTGFMSVGNTLQAQSYSVYYEPEEELLVFYYNQGFAPAEVIYITGSWVPKALTWYHIAVIRGWSGNANDFAITVDGSAVGTGTDSDTIDATSTLGTELRVLNGDQSTQFRTLDVDWGVEHLAVVARMDGSGEGVVKTSDEKKFGTGSWFTFNTERSDFVGLYSSSGTFDITFGQDYSIEAFIKLSDHSGESGIFNQWDAGSGGSGQQFWHEHGVGLRYTLEGPSNAISLTGAEITDGNWHHVLVVIEADGDCGIYLDGAQGGFDTYDSVTNSAAFGYLMGSASTGLQAFDGYLDEFRFYHGDPFGAAPVVGVSDSITVPLEAHKTDSDTKVLIHGDPYYLSGYIDEFRITSAALWTANFSVIGGAPASMIQLQSPHAISSYVLITGNNDSAGESNVIHNETDIPDQGNFEGGQLNKNPLNANPGRFSRAPNGNIAYTNGDQSMIWGGDESRIAAYYTVKAIAATYADLTYATDETVTTAGGNYITDGFLPGKVISITGSSSNNKTFTIKEISSGGDVITVVEDGMAAEGGSASGTFTISTPREDPIDWTREVTNSLSSAGNITTLGGGIDSDVKLMLHLDGTDQSTTFTDSSASSHSPSANGDAKLTTSVLKFGTASSTYDGTGDYITVPDDADFFLSTGDFTIDFWFKFDPTAVTGGAYGFFQQITDTSNTAGCFYVDGIIYFVIRASGTQTIRASAQLDFETNRWFHVAVIRGWSGSSTSWAVIIDGKTGGVLGSGSATWADYTGDFEVGRGYSNIVGAVGQKLMLGEIDEFRLSKGIARWIAGFAPQQTAYSVSRRTFYVFSNRPLQGIKLYISSVNTTSSSMSGQVWNGTAFADLALGDNTSVGGISLAQTGTITFDSTVDIAKPFNFEDKLLYACKFVLSAGAADIYQVTSDAPFQDIVDIWDSIPRRPIAFNLWDNSSGTFRDYTLEITENSDTSDNAFGAEIGQTTDSDHIIIMFDERQTALTFFLIAAKVNTNPSIPTILYFNGSEYITTGTVVDETIADPLVWETLGGSGRWSWQAPNIAEEKTLSAFGVTGYAYKITFDQTLSGSSVSDIIVDRVFGRPAQNIVNAFSFPQMHKDRLMLFSYINGNEGNRVDFSQKNAPDVWNGEDSSQGGEHGSQSLFFGGRENITAAASVFNRYGSNIFTALLVLKDTETYLLVGDGPPATSDNPYRIFPLSDAIGCPAPHTLVTAEVAFEVGESEKRNLAIWMSYSGVWLFNGSVPQPIDGIDKFFDPNDSDFINYEAIDKSHAFYNPRFKEYNLFIPSGSGQATVNKWLVYDLVKEKWSERVPSDYPQATTAVVDTDGARYVYGALDNGFMVRLENSTTWDGDAIASVVETGDFFPTASFWDKTYIRKFKVVASAISEASKNLTITVYTDTEVSGTVLGTTLDLDGETGTERLVRNTQSMLDTIGPAWTYRFKFEVSTSATGPDLDLFGWGYLVRIVREDF